MTIAAELTDLGREQDPHEEEKKRRARSEVSTAAMRGEVPSRTFSHRDLDWAFADHKDDLARLEATAVEIKQTGKPKPRDPRWRELNSTIDSVLNEWDAAEKAERRARARVEALSRLGLSEPEAGG